VLLDSIRRVPSLLVGVTALFAWFGQAAHAQTDRDVLRNLLRIYYVDQPNNADSTYRPQLLDNAAIASGTETGPFWTNPAMARAQDLVRRLLRERARGGDPSLQFYVAGIVNILNKPVKVNLLDDTHGPITNTTVARWGACFGANSRAWPCASNMASDDDWAQACALRKHEAPPARHDDMWAGNIALGENYLDSVSQVTALATIVHELVHTQDHADWRGHLFWVAGLQYSYGHDSTHYTTEAVPNLAMTYKEGIADGISLLYAATQPIFDTLSAFRWFATNGELLVERTAVASGTGPQPVDTCTEATAPSADVWLYDQLQRAGAHEIRQWTSPTTGGHYAVYRVRDLPPQFVAHNEFVLALIIQQYVDHVGLRRFMTALNQANEHLFRVTASGIATLFDFMSSVGLPAGQTAAGLAAARASQLGPKQYLLPLAYADYFTGYRAGSKGEFKAFFENMSFMNTWIDLYWDGERQNVRAAVPLTNPKPEDLTNIAIALGITQSIPD